MRSALESFGADRPLPPPAAARGSTTGADCRNCPFATKEGLPNRPVCGEGPEDPLWIVVGEGPGHNEQIFGRPFIGASGAVMDKILASLGRPRQDIWIANATLCRPYDGADEKVRDRAAQACRERLRLELARFPGKPILSVGAPAARVLIPHAFGDRGDTAPKTAKQAAAQAMTAVTQAAQAGTLAVDTRTRAEVQAERREAAKQRKLDAIAARRAAREAAKTAKASGAVVIKLGPLARVDKPKKTIKIKAPKLPKPPKPPKARRPKGVSKGKGLSFSDLVSTLHMTPFVGEGDIRLVIPTIHPAALLRAGAKPLKGAHGADLVYWNLLYDAGKLDALARGVDCRFTEDGETEVADSVRATRLVLDIVAEARACGELAVDLETHVFDEQRHHALMMYVAQIKAIGLATPSRGVSVMWDLLGPTAKAAIGSALGDPKIVTVYHNGLYDRTVLRARGFNLADEYADTLLAHHATFPGMAHKLQYVAGQFFAIRPWKSEFRDGDETPEALTKYNMYDVLSTARLRAPLEILVKKTKTEKVYEIDRCMGTIASHMHLWGVPMSRDVNEQLLVQFRDNVKQAREAIEAVANDPDTLEQIKHRIAIEEAYTKRKNDPEDYRERQLTRVAQIEQKIAKGKWAWSVDKTTHVVGLLQALGVNLVTKTASGRTATSKAILDALVDVPIVRRIVNYRENAKLLSTFVWAIFDRYHADGTIRTYGFADEEDRVHPSWSITKISGRWASTEPVLSNVPKADAKKGRPNLRTQVVAPPGRIFVGFDFSQLEARGIALVSGDPWLCDVFAQGKDIHTEAMKVVWGEKIIQLKDVDKARFKVLRDAVKRFEYGAFYGGSVETLWKTLLKDDQNVKYNDVAAAVYKLMGAMPLVTKWQDDAVATASKPPNEIRSRILGRRRVFPLAADRSEAINIGIQSLGADIMDTGMWRMWQKLPRYNGTCFPILQIHDAAVFECDEDDADRVKSDVLDAFTQEYGGIPFPIEVDIAHDWAGV